MDNEEYLKKIENHNKWTLRFAIAAVIISLVSCGFQYWTNMRAKKEIEIARAPIFHISSMRFQSSKDLKFPKAYNMPNNCEFSIAKRHYIKKNKLKSSVMSLIIDGTPIDSMLEKYYLVNLNKLVIDNIGFESVYLEIRSIDVYGEDSKIRITHNNQNKIIRRINENNPLELYITLTLSKDSFLVNKKVVENPEYFGEKLKETQGELLNSTFKDRADLWNRMEINIVSKNAFNEYYEQQLILLIENDTYFATQNEPKIMDKRDSNELDSEKFSIKK